MAKPDSRIPPAGRLGIGAAIGAGVGLVGWLLIAFTTRSELLSAGACLTFVLGGAVLCAAGGFLFDTVTGAAIGMTLGGLIGTVVSAPPPPPTNRQQTVELSGPTLTGESFDIKSYRGKVVIVDFWATWCPPCVAEMPGLKKLYDEKHSDGLEVVGVSLDQSRSKLARFVEKEKIEWPQLFWPEQESEKPNPLAVRMGVSSIPHTLLIDREGKLVAVGLRGGELDRAARNVLADQDPALGDAAMPASILALAAFGALVGSLLLSGRWARAGS